MNGYAQLNVLKAENKMTADVNDDALVSLIEDVSRAFDNVTQRHFYSEIGTRYFSGDGGRTLRVDDILSVTSLDIDADADQTWGTNLPVAGWALRPRNELPYRRIWLNGLGAYGVWAESDDYVKVTGMFGYSNETELTGATLGEALDTSETAIDISSGPLVSVGETIVVEDEQMSVSAIATNTLTVVRGVNGTSAVTHSTGLAVYRRRYARPIERAVKMEATRLLRAQETGYSGTLSADGVGGYQYTSLYPMIQDLIAPYGPGKMVFA